MIYQIPWFPGSWMSSYGPYSKRFRIVSVTTSILPLSNTSWYVSNFFAICIQSFPQIVWVLDFFSSTLCMQSFRCISGASWHFVFASCKISSMVVLMVSPSGSKLTCVFVGWSREYLSLSKYFSKLVFQSLATRASTFALVTPLSMVVEPSSCASVVGFGSLVTGVFLCRWL